MSDRVRVLAVDDSITIRKALELILVPAGYEVAFAASGAEALAQIRQEAPALILLDFILPDMRGSEVCRVLREDPATADLPVVLISARGAEIRQAYQDAPNVVRYLAKPFTPIEVLNTVAELAVHNGRAATEVVASASLPTADAVAPSGASGVAADTARDTDRAGLIPAPMSLDDRATEAAGQSALDAGPSLSAVAPTIDVVSPVFEPSPLEAGAQPDEAGADDLIGIEPESIHPPRPRDTQEWMFEMLRAGLEGVLVEEMDTPTGATADQAKSYTELASRLSEQLGEALRQAESGGRYALCGDGSIRSLGDTLLDSYRRVCRLLFRAAAAGAVERNGGDARPRVLVVCHADSAVYDVADRATRDADDWLAFSVCSDFRQLPMTVRLFGPTHIIVEAAAGRSAVWDQLRLVRAMPEARRTRMLGIRPVAGDGAEAPVGLLEELGIGALLEPDADLPAAVRASVLPAPNAAM